MALHDYVLQHSALKVKQEAERVDFWKGFFKQISDLISQSESIKQVSFTFQVEFIGSDALVLEDLVFNSKTCDIQNIRSERDPAIGSNDTELMDYIQKVCNNTLHEFLYEFDHLDCDDWIVVTPDSVEANFRHYEHWDLSTTQPLGVHLF